MVVASHLAPGAHCVVEQLMVVECADRPIGYQLGVE
jgi:hypothetical protein